jgi:predicted dehydrogenase
MTVNTLGLAIIGAGMMGTLRGRVARANGAVGHITVYDVDRDKAAAVARLIDAQVCESAQQAIENAEVQAVSVSTGPKFHYDIGMQAVRAGRCVLVEKPFTQTVEHARELTSAADENGVGLFVGYSQRFRHQFLSARHHVALGQLGQLTGGLMTFYTTRGRAERRLDREPTASPTGNNFPHLADLALWFMNGELPFRVTAVSSRGPLGRHRDVALTAWTTVQFEGGGVITMGTSWELPPNYPAYHASIGVDMFGTRGVLRNDDSHRDAILSSDGPMIALDAPDMPGLELEQVFLGTYPPGGEAFHQIWGAVKDETDAFISCAARGVTSHDVLSGGGEATNVRTLIAAAAASLESGQPVLV